MSDASLFLAQGLISEVGGTDFAPPAELRIQLFAGPPGAFGSNNPAFYTQREQMLHGAPASGVITNNNQITWSAWQTANQNTQDHVRYWAMFDAPSGGNCLMRAPLGGQFSKPCKCVASSDLLTSLGTGFVNGDIVDLAAEDGLDLAGTNLSEDFNYYVVNANPPSFQLSTTLGGSALDVGADRLLRVRQVIDYAINPNMPVYIPIGGLSVRFI